MQELSRPITAKSANAARSKLGYALIVLPLIGLMISGYLWSAKAGATAFICGGMSDCESVNMSFYSSIGGIPIAAAGAMMYLALTGLGIMTVRQGRKANPTLILVAFALAFSGALYSLYLTGVEAFVLRAYCIWCLCSWIIITALAVLWWRRNQEASA